MLTLQNISVTLEDNPVLHNINLRVEDGEIFCLLGPSGCGKTTLLRVVAGLEEADEGVIRYDGEPINHLPANRRGFGLMFQSYALFPHMNVADNIMFGLKMRKYSREEAEARMREVLDIVELEGFEKRSVNKLSGGQQQRVALARSLAPNPRLLMLDEPLGSLDVGLSRQLLIELRQIIKRVGLTAIYVTHNQQEAFSIGDRVGVMNAGRIEQIGTARTLYTNPNTVFTAKFLGLTNIVPVVDRTNGLVHTPVGNFHVERPASAVLIHPDGVHLADPDTPGALVGRLLERSFQGNTYRAQAEIAPGIVFNFQMSALDPNTPDVGDTVGLIYDDVAVLGLQGPYN
jgi:ABC-type Fe3+/spermidine/putrescine transport system ATPase subunit